MNRLQFFDTHAHLCSSQFDDDRSQVLQRMQAAGVTRHLEIAYSLESARRVVEFATATEQCWAVVGVQPNHPEDALLPDWIDQLRQIAQHPKVVAIGEIGLDYFVPGLDPVRQERFYRAQLQLARRFDLPVILHVRRSADKLLKGLRDVPVRGGIAHAFNGSLQQAQAFIGLGFKLGFGGAVTYDRALQLRRLATELPGDALVLETDAPDIPPHWLYTTAAERAAGQPQGRNSPGELPGIAAVVAQLRGQPVEALAGSTRANALAALPRLESLLADARPSQGG